MCVCVLREFIRNAENTLAMSKLMHRKCFLILGQEYRWFVVSIAVVGVLQESGKHISESSAIIDNFNLFLWKHISSYLIYSLR